ncbi:MAG: hypothetical protein ABSF10_21355 [Verrucomicrobiota bacterium]|jgi:hypothetical protein
MNTTTHHRATLPACASLRYAGRALIARRIQFTARKAATLHGATVSAKTHRLFFYPFLSLFCGFGASCCILCKSEKTLDTIDSKGCSMLSMVC